MRAVTGAPESPGRKSWNGTVVALLELVAAGLELVVVVAWREGARCFAAARVVVLPAQPTTVTVIMTAKPRIIALPSGVLN